MLVLERDSDARAREELAGKDDPAFLRLVARAEFLVVGHERDATELRKALEVLRRRGGRFDLLIVPREYAVPDVSTQLSALGLGHRHVMLLDADESCLFEALCHSMPHAAIRRETTVDSLVRALETVPRCC